jgi:hypothetical protein
VTGALGGGGNEGCLWARPRYGLSAGGRATIDFSVELASAADARAAGLERQLAKVAINHLVELASAADSRAELRTRVLLGLERHLAEVTINRLVELSPAIDSRAALLARALLGTRSTAWLCLLRLRPRSVHCPQLLRPTINRGAVLAPVKYLFAAPLAAFARHDQPLRCIASPKYSLAALLAASSRHDQPLSCIASPKYSLAALLAASSRHDQPLGCIASAEYSVAALLAAFARHDQLLGCGCSGGPARCTAGGFFARRVDAWLLVGRRTA